MKWHIWDFPLTKICVLLNKDVREKFINRAISKSRQIIKQNVRRNADKLGIILKQRAIKYGLRVNYNYRIIFHWRKGEIYIPLWVILELSNFLDDDAFSLQEIEKYIESYRGLRGGGIVRPYYKGKYLLPLSLKPELVALYFHMIGDGCFCDKSGTSTYSQLDKRSRDYFIKKLNVCFGEFKVSQKTYDNCYVMFPTVITHILSYIFGVNSFLSKTARILRLIKSLSKNYKFAGIVAFLSDEGNITDSIRIHSSNKKLLIDIRNILENMKYETTLLYYRQDNKFDIYTLCIKNECLERFYEDYVHLIKRNPSCSLLRKEIYLQILLEIHKRGKGYYYNKKDLMNKIIKILNRKMMKTNEIRVKLFKIYNEPISYHALYKHLVKLERNNLIRKDLNSSKDYMWSLIS